jgi:hypothetical protein
MERLGRMTNSNSLLVSALLIISGVEGITPDSWDLASLRLMAIVCPPLADQVPAETPDAIGELCGPLGSERREVLSKLTNNTRISSFLLVPPRWPDNRAVSSLITSPADDRISIAGLTFPLCRLQC